MPVTQYSAARLVSYPAALSDSRAAACGRTSSARQGKPNTRSIVHDGTPWTARTPTHPPSARIALCPCPSPSYASNETPPACQAAPLPTALESDGFVIRVHGRRGTFCPQGSRHSLQASWSANHHFSYAIPTHETAGGLQLAAIGSQPYKSH